MLSLSICFALWAVLAAAVGQPFSHPSSRSPNNITQTKVYTAGEDGYYCFRIPALLFTVKGTLLAFAEGRGQTTNVCDDHGDVHIVLKRSSDLGQTWSNLTTVYQESGHTIGEPCTAVNEQSSTSQIVDLAKLTYIC